MMVGLLSTNVELFSLYIVLALAGKYLAIGLFALKLFDHYLTI